MKGGFLYFALIFVATWIQPNDVMGGEYLNAKIFGRFKLLKLKI